MTELRPTIHVIGGTTEQRMRLARHIERMPAYEKLYLHSGAIDIGALTPVPANPELDEAMFGAVGWNPAVRKVPERPWHVNEMPATAPLYDKLVAPQGRKQVTILVPERGVDGKTIRALVVEKELTQVFGWYLATHGVRGSSDSAKTPVIAYTVAVADDLGVRDAVGIAGRAAALTGAPVTVTLDTGDVVKVDAMGQFV